VEFGHPADIAAHLEGLSLEKQISLLRGMSADDAAEALAELDEEMAGGVLENLDPDEASAIIAEMDPDDAADVLNELEEEHRDILLRGLAAEDADGLRRLLTFDPDTAGGIMNTDIILLRAGLTADEAVRQIRAEMRDKETPYYGYVVDDGGILIGVMSLRDLMLCPSGDSLRRHLREPVCVTFDAHRAEVARVMSHYNFMAIPVVDYARRPLGIVTYDDVLDVFEDAASSDMLGMVGAGQDENVDTPWRQSVRLRLPWLCINLLNSALSASVVYLFEGSIAAMATLAVLMPMVANQAGNTGQQALAVMIRQLAMERFDRRKAWMAVLREGKIGLAAGAIMALLAFFGVWGFSGQTELGMVMGMALISDMVLGAIAGGSIPLILRALGRDPAQASSIFLTTLTDGAGFFIFLGLATMLLL
jgi:magnesium transporter